MILIRVEVGMGLKKCSFRKFVGWRCFEVRLLIEMDEVFDVRIVFLVIVVLV